MFRALRITFLLFTLLTFLVGAALLAAPGRFLGFFGWAPIDPLLSRVLGAALLGLAWSCLRGWRTTERSQVATLVELNAIFCVLACIGLLRHLLVAYYPPMVWVVFAALALFGAAWVFFWIKKP